MKILYLSQHFPPEIGAAQGRAYDMAKNLVKEGHEVTVLTTFPNHEKNRSLFKKETKEGIEVRRSFRFQDTKKSSKARLANYFSFMFSSIISGLLVRKTDAVYASSPHLFTAASGYILSRLLRKPFILEVRDLWVDFAKILSQFSNPLLLKWARKLENFLYQKAEHIITVTHGYKEHLIKQGVDGRKINVVTNGVDIEDIQSAASEEKEEIRKKHELGNDLVVLYAGNMGAAQGLDVVLDAANILGPEAEVTFCFIGEGVEKDPLKAKADFEHIPNLLFLDSMNKEELMPYYQAADLCLVTLKNHPLFHITIPSKVFDCMAAGKPVLIGVGGEATDIVLENEAGIAFEPGNAEELAEAVDKAVKNREWIKELESNVTEVVKQKYNRRILAKKLSGILENVVKGEKND
ncbi:glycosyltransferase family 4 protein [Thalassobacillus sp. C254]|uniref:glycosyltransferase family 4 protein n=1 Tax=Thalassobacillus sp. C254 TaxID=1225341 RepID=UPI0006D24730|nr:glycosyltransferase family 4 protein [Thalassobacillus sp. C254]